MNKYQEALKTFKHVIRKLCSLDDTYYQEEFELEEKALQELVDKATPKMPKVSQEPYDDGITDDIRYIDLNYCDTCGSLLTAGKCCSNNDCRQAIDWSEDE